MKKIYVDTHIFADYWGDRSDNRLPLGEFAFRLFKETLSCKFLILISELVYDEAKTCQFGELFKTDLIVSITEVEKLKIVAVSQEQAGEAKKVSKRLEIPKGDALHAILARDNNAVLVRRDKHHEIALEQINFELAKPEELI